MTIIDPTAREDVWNEAAQQMPDTAIDRDINLNDHEFEPWGLWMLVEEFPPDTMTRGGLHLPDSFKTQKSWGTVKKISPKIKDLKVGDTILYTLGSGVEMQILGPNLRLVEYRDDFEADILGVFRPKKVDTDAPESA